MSKNDHASAALRNTMIDAGAALFNSGDWNLYDGTQPVDAGTALSGNTKLAGLAFGATAFAASSGGSATANAITSDTDADATGTASFFRTLKSDHTTVLQDGNVGIVDENLVMNTVSIVVHATVAITSATMSMAA